MDNAIFLCSIRFFILTRHCQVTAPAWKLIRDLNVDPIQVKDDGADDEKDDEEKAFQCTECDFRSDCRRRFLSHYELAHVMPDNFSCEFWCAFCTWFSPINATYFFVVG